MRILYIEPFDRGSHQQFTGALTQGVEAEWTVLRLAGRHWKWRMRGSAAWAALTHAETLAAGYDLVFASSYLPLAELIGLAPALATVPRVLYFHENQLAFPVRGGQAPERDHHFGFTQLVSALAASECWFNSRYNMTSFLAEARPLLERLPDAVPPGWVERIEERSRVLGIPLALGAEEHVPDESAVEDRALGPIVTWNHRWEHDKRPDRFFRALRWLAEAGVPFRVAVCGQRFRRAPDVFEDARGWLGERVVHWGYVDSRAEYEALLRRCHIAVSTADHEFFGISMLEATHFGLYPLVPDKLSYPELFPAEYRYAEATDFERRLEQLCRDWTAGRQTLRADRRAITEPYGGALLRRYETAIEQVIALGPPALVG